MQASISDGKTTRTIHTAWNINLMKRLILSDKTGDGFIQNKETGRDLTKAEALKELNKLQKKGFKVVPPCDDYDKDGICKGHEVS